MVASSFLAFNLLASLTLTALTYKDGKVNFAVTPNQHPSNLSILVTNPSSQKLTNSQAFTTGAGNTNNGNIYDGTGNAGTDTYRYYYNEWQNFPPVSQ